MFRLWVPTRVFTQAMIFIGRYTLIVYIVHVSFANLASTVSVNRFWMAGCALVLSLGFAVLIHPTYMYLEKAVMGDSKKKTVTEKNPA